MTIFFKFTRIELSYYSQERLRKITFSIPLHSAPSGAIQSKTVLPYSTITARFSSGSAKRLFMSPSAFFTRRSGDTPYLLTNSS